jgi:dipeptidyl-peptidase 4
MNPVMLLRRPFLVFMGLLWPCLFWAQKSITLDDCFTHYRFYPENPGKGFHYLRDGVHYAEADDKGYLHIYDVRNEKFDSLITLNLPEAAKGFDQFTFSEDESKLLLRNHTETVYRHSVKADYFVYDFNTKQTQPVFEGGKIQHIEFAPDAKSLVFVFNNNLYVKDLGLNKIVQITKDGAPNQIINGLPDWVYEEEFSPVDGDGMVAVRWSPNSKLLAFIRFDESQVPTMPLTWYEDGMYPRQSTFKYPKVGENNAIVSVHLYNTETDAMLGKIMGIEQTDYVPRIHWTPDNQLVVTRLNRHQDTLELLQALPERTVFDQDERLLYIPVRPLLRETDPAYVEIESENKLIFLEKSRHFLWTSERSGFQHLYRFPSNPAASEKETALTKGSFDVTAFYGVDEQNGSFYYQTATPTPLDRQVWEGYLNGDAPRLLTPGKGTHDASFSPTFDYFTHTWSDANTPPVVTLRDRKGNALRSFTDNNRVAKNAKEYGFVKKEFFTFTLPDGTPLNGWILKPANASAEKKCPVLFDVYGGPGSQTVQNQYDGYVGAWHQMLVQKGVAVVSVDNRGTGGRGRDFKKCTQLKLGHYETEDQIAAARYLATLPDLDGTRIGIWGWSFGGYLSTSCVLKGSEIFKMAMAVAPVTNWKWYDSAYTERYMRDIKSNGKGYEDNSPVNFAGNLRGNNYLICHGVTDDNVHWQQAVEMIQALIKANRQFETYYYPNRNHGIYGDNATRHLFTKLTNFVLEKL